MKIHFLGGVDTVTGSQHLLEVGRARVVRDCGLFQGRRAEARAINERLARGPGGVDAMVLSHAHIDHGGNIPTYARRGGRAPIHATTATVDLCGVMLADAARIQEQDAAYLNQKHGREHLPPVEPLYETADAERAMTLFRGHAYHAPFEAAPGVTAEFLEAGHILGAALTLFTLREGGREARVGLAFDLGRRDLPLIRDPDPMADLDAMVIESTYGGRRHDDARTAASRLRDVVRRTFDRGGKVLIPSFALERAQEVLYHLTDLVDRGELDPPSVYVDSPLADRVTGIFERSVGYLDDEALERRRRWGRILTPPWVRFTSSVEDSKAVTAADRPCIVIAASGMCEHGRILHHLKHGIGDPRHAVVLVGYQAAHTLGRRLADGDARVRIFGDWHERRAEVVNLNVFSAHADHDDLVRYVREAKPRRVFLVHGDDDARAALAEGLKAAGFDAVHRPRPGDVAEI
jgi:metallo-beta-lactamase family protein